VARAQAVARYNFGIARREAAKSTAFGEKARSGGATDRAVHAAAAGKRRIGGAHNGVDGNPRDVLLVSQFDCGSVIATTLQRPSYVFVAHGNSAPWLVAVIQFQIGFVA
jgi:hypothetical protein